MGGLTLAGNGFSSCDLNHDTLPPVERLEQVKVSMSTLLRQRRKTPILGTKPEQQMQCEDISKHLSKIWIMKLQAPGFTDEMTGSRVKYALDEYGCDLNYWY